MITFTEVKVLDRNAELAGTPTLTLMENAGRSAAQSIRKQFIDPYRKDHDGAAPPICLLCGKGNNGGDGYVVARYLVEAGCEDITVLLLCRKDEIRSGISRKNFLRMPSDVRVIEYDAMVNDLSEGRSASGSADADPFLFDEYLKEAERTLEHATIIIDAMLGIGIFGSLRTPYAELIDLVNSWRNESEDGRQDEEAKGEEKEGTGDCRTVVSLDVPSGFGGDVFVQADSTVTFHDMKYGMEILDNVEVVDIGIPSAAQRFVDAGEFAYFPVPGKHAHKGDAGRLVIIGGGPFTGAPALAARAAFRTGVDLVRIAVPAAIAPIIASFDMNFMVTPLAAAMPGVPHLVPYNLKQLAPLMNRADAVVIGPGLGAAPETLETVVRLLEAHPKTPAVIDADAITALSKLNTDRRRALLASRPCVLTPHRAEFTRISGHTGLSNQFTEAECRSVDEAAVAAFSQENQCTVLMKGCEDIIAGPGDGELRINRTGHPSMSVGGTGDILAGCCGSLLARGIPPFAAARMAAHLNGLAGEAAFEKVGWGVVATDIVDELSGTLMTMLECYCGESESQR